MNSKNIAPSGAPLPTSNDPLAPQLRRNASGLLVPLDSVKPATGQYENLVAIRNTELQTHWTRYNILVVLNGGLIAAWLARDPTHNLGLPTTYVCIGGLFVAGTWALTVIQGKRLLHRWDAHLIEFEQRLGSSKYYPLLTCVASDKKRWWSNLTGLALAIPAVCAAFWGLVWAAL